MDFNQLIEQSQKSSFGLWKLNFLLQRFIPFNKPHGLKVTTITKNEVKVSLPYKKNNLNHIKGLHACGLATAAEYASGLLLLYKLGAKDYRIIMESLSVEYKYQGKSDGTAIFKIEETDFIDNVLQPLTKGGVVYRKCTMEVLDKKENLLCIATTNWQIKKWEMVKTKSK